MLGMGLTAMSGNIKNAFTITDVSDLELWYQRNVGVTTAKWTDSSGNDNHSIQQTESNKATVTVDGGLDFEKDNNHHYDFTNIAIANNQGFAMGLVATLETVANASIFSDSANEFIRITNGRTFSVGTNGGEENLVTNIVTPANTYNAGQKVAVLVNRKSGSNGGFTIFVNGVRLVIDTDLSALEANGENTKGFTIDTLGTTNASTNPFDGTMHEVVFFSKGLDNEEIADVNSYLKNNNGL